MEHHVATIADVACRVYRLSFTGEVSYELHHPAEHSVALWRRLFELGADLGVKPHGIEALLKLRLEKGHIIVGQDSDFDSTPRRLNHEWAVKLDKPDFVGKQAILRTNKLPLDKQLVGLEMNGSAPVEGAVIYRGDDYAGFVTSSLASPLLGKTVMLGWLKLFDGALPDEVTINSRIARRVQTPFYDPEGARARASAETSRVLATNAATTSSLTETREVFTRIPGARIVATPAALDVAKWPDDAIVLRFAPDEVFVASQKLDSFKESDFSIADPHAIVAPDAGFAGVWLPMDQAMDFLSRECEWELPRARPAFVQGAVAGLAMKLWFEHERVLLLVPAPFAHELEGRLLK